MTPGGLTDAQLAAVLKALFLSLGQANRPKTLLNASVLLAQLASKSDPGVKEMAEQTLASVDGA